MGAQKLCACDRTRQSAIGVQIGFVDTVKQPFAAIVKGLSDVSEDGLWLNPFRGIPPGPRLSRFDVIYLDENCRVLEYAENFTEAEFEPLSKTPASALMSRRTPSLRSTSKEEIGSGSAGTVKLSQVSMTCRRKLTVMMRFNARRTSDFQHQRSRCSIMKRPPSNLKLMKSLR